MIRVQHSVCLLLVLGILAANPTNTRANNSTPPPIPKYDQVALPGQQPVLFGENGEAAWITITFSHKPMLLRGCSLHHVVKRSWNPATGAFSDTTLGIESSAVAEQLATPLGIFFLMPSLCRDRVGHIGLLTPAGKVVTAPVTHNYLFPHLVLLADRAVAVLSRNEATRHIKTDIVRVRRDGTLSIEQMPELQVASRNDFREAALPDGRLMVIGGSDAPYRGCSPCRAETYILNPKKFSWSPGPSMLEPRSEHLATRLPDGSILVTGGWTPTQGWGHGPSRSAERWNPVTNKFESVAPMPSGTSRHQAEWMPGQKNKTLLIAGGTSSSIHAYDIRSGEWRLVGVTRQGSEEGGCALIPFIHAGNVYTWIAYQSEGHYSSKSCTSQQDWTLAALRFASVPANPVPENFLITYRSSAAMLPASGNRPALTLGGSLHAGMNSYLVSSAVEAIDKNGGMRLLPSLVEARRGAVAFRMGDGVLVIGGQGEDRNNSRPAKRQLPMEWLASDAPNGNARWVKLVGPTFDPSAALGQLTDGSLLAVDGRGGVSRLLLNPGSDGLPAIQMNRDSLPRLNRARRSEGEPGSPYSTTVQIRALPDGRIVVAGGYVQSEKIALLRDDASQPSAVDEYVGIGEYLPSRRHEIYEPDVKRWRTTAPARGAGGKVAILSDGRVLKIGQLPGKNEHEPSYVLELSNAEGSAWTALPGNPPAIKLSNSATPFVIEDELFLVGEVNSLSTGGGASGVEWFNAASGKWEILWQAKPGDNWRDHHGRFIVRQLANGKKVVLPVNGF